MTTLNKPQLGTDPGKGWHFYALHMATSYVLREYFLVSNYSKSIKLSLKHGENTEKVHRKLEKIKGHKLPYSDQIISNAKELSSWAKSMEQENYHDLYVHSFIGMWSSFEAGIVNIIADFILNDFTVAKPIPELFKKCKHKVEDWPWNKTICLELAQKLEPKAKRETENGGVDFFERLKTLFSYIGIHLELDQVNKDALAEANRMRNILLHRYGEITPKDAVDFPILAEWEGRVMPFNKDIFNRYYNAISSTFISLMQAIQKSKVVNEA